jgi:hypothetical protein
MKKNSLTYLLIILIQFACNNQEKVVNIVVSQITSNKILRQLVKEKKIQGTLIKNWYGVTRTDTLVTLSFTFPESQSYPIDSIYYLSYDEDNLKILAQSEFEKGLIYIEGNKSGLHCKFYSFGGYVKRVTNLKIDNEGNRIFIEFKCIVWGSTMPKPIEQIIKIESQKFKPEFKVFFKNTEGNWISTSND